jgi:hypothetical protein
MSGVETRFGADTTPFTRGVESMKAQVKGLGNSLQSSVGGGVKGMIAGLAAGFSVGAIKDIFNELDRLNDLGKTLGQTPEEMQRLAMAAKLGGSDVEKLATSFVKATQAVREYRAGLKSVGEDGQDGKRIGRAMGQLGINSAAFVSAGTTDQVLMVARGMEAMEDKTLASAAALDLLGVKAKDLLPVLQEGEAGVKSAMGAASILSNDDVARIAKFNDELDVLFQNLKLVAAKVGTKALGFGQMFSSAGLAIGGMVGKVGGLFSDELDASANQWLDASDKLRGEMNKNLFGKEDPKIFSTKDEDAKKKEEAARIETETKISGLRSAAEEKIADMRSAQTQAALSNEEKIATLRNSYEEKMKGNDFEGAVKAQEELIKVENEVAKEAKKLAEEKADAIQSLAELEKDTARERLSVEEQIAALRKEAIEQAEAGNFKAAAEAGKELTGLIGKQIDERKKSQESLQGNAGVIADSLRKSGLGGVAVSASINKSILQVNKDAVAELRAIKEKIGQTDNTPRFK